MTAARWRTITGLSWIVVTVASATVLSGLALLGAVAHRRRVFLAGSLDELDQADRIAQVCFVTNLAFTVLGGVVLVVWIYRSAQNVLALGRTGQRWSPGLAVGSWFIPVAQMVLPFMILDEIWRGSTPELTSGDRWKATRGNRIVWVWMVAWIIRTAAQLSVPSLDASTLEGVRTALDRQVVAVGVMIGALMISGGCMAIVVRRLTSRLDTALTAAQAAARLMAAPRVPPSPSLPPGSPLPPPRPLS